MPEYEAKFIAPAVAAAVERLGSIAHRLFDFLQRDLRDWRRWVRVRRSPRVVVDKGVRLVIVGHFGYAEDRTPFGHAVNLGGSGYACAVGAGAGDPGRVGIVARIGDDFDVAALMRLGVDRTGAATVPGPAPQLTITQHPSGDRTFTSNLGVAASPEKSTFPPAYWKATHVHLATMPPAEQSYWLRTVRELSDCRISVDMFEQTAADLPNESRALCHSVDLVFMNDRERRLLFSAHPLPAADIVLKTGPGGAAYRSGRRWIRVPAPRVTAVDTTGAGEVLAGSFLSLRALNIPIPAALRLAVEAASAKVTEFGVDGPNLRRAVASIRCEIAEQQLQMRIASRD